MPQINNTLQVHVKLSKEVSFEWSRIIHRLKCQMLSTA